MKWQKCPVCNGSGMIQTYYGYNSCHVCGGKGIIPEPTQKEIDDWHNQSEHYKVKEVTA